MDAKLMEMLKEAERVRLGGNFYGHKTQLRAIILYYRDNIVAANPNQGDVLQGTASEENLAIATEFAAGVLFFNHNTHIGSIADLSREEKIALNRKAANLARAHRN